MTYPYNPEAPAVPPGRKLCPDCRGSGIVGTRTLDPQQEQSDDCPTCAPRGTDGRRDEWAASLGHVAR